MGDIIPQKRCPACTNFFPATSEFFHRDKRKKDGLHSQCKTCINTYKRAYDRRPDVTEKTNTYQRSYNKRPEVRERRRIRRHTPKREEHTRLHHEEYVNRPEVKEHLQAYRKAYWSRPEGKARHRSQQHTRIARKKAILGTYTPEQIHELYDRQKGKCYYCSKKVKWGKHEVEHTFPLSRVGGSDIPANDISYIVIACSPCNRKKHNKFPWEWPEGGRLL